MTTAECNDTMTETILDNTDSHETGSGVDTLKHWSWVKQVDGVFLTGAEKITISSWQRSE